MEDITLSGLGSVSILISSGDTLGKIGEFQPSVEDWMQYAKHLEFFFAANGIMRAQQKCTIFLVVVGPTTYKLLHSMLAPTTLGELAFDKMVKVLLDHYCPKPSEIVSYFKFYKPQKTVSTFISEVRALATFCNFGNLLDAMIRDCLVCGINNEQIYYLKEIH